MPGLPMREPVAPATSRRVGTLGSTPTDPGDWVALPASSAATRGPGPRFPRRGWLTAFVTKHNLAWDLVFGAFAIAYLGVGIAADTGNDAYDVVIGTLAVVFLAEFGLRLADSPNRYMYLRGHWIDLVSAIPLIGGLRSLRLLRLLRLGAALRILASAEQGARKQGGGRQSLWYIGPALVVIWFTSAIAYYLLERDADPKVRGFGDALSWAFMTATTVGYGTETPVTAGGKMLNGLLILVSLGLVGVISSRLVTAWLGVEADESGRRVEVRLGQIEIGLAGLHSALAALETRLHDLPAGGRIPTSRERDTAGDTRDDSGSLRDDVAVEHEVERALAHLEPRLTEPGKGRVQTEQAVQVAEPCGALPEQIRRRPSEK